MEPWYHPMGPDEADQVRGVGPDKPIQGTQAAMGGGGLRIRWRANSAQEDVGGRSGIFGRQSPSKQVQSALRQTRIFLMWWPIPRPLPQVCPGLLGSGAAA